MLERIKDIPLLDLPKELVQAFCFTWGIEGWMRFEDAMLIANLTLQAEATGDMVEVGCWKGKLSIILATVAKIRNRKEHLLCIDPFGGWNYTQDGYQPPPPGHPWSQPTFDHFMNNIKRAGLIDNIEIFRYTSRNALRKLPNRRLSLIFIDGNHSYSAVRADVEGYLPLLLKNGHMILDDIANQDTPGPGMVNRELQQRVDCDQIFQNEKISVFQKR